MIIQHSDLVVIADKVLNRIQQEINLPGSKSQDGSQFLTISNDKPIFKYIRKINIDPIDRYFEVSGILNEIKRVKLESPNLRHWHLQDEVLGWIDSDYIRVPEILWLGQQFFKNKIDRRSYKDNFDIFTKIVYEELINFECKLEKTKEKILKKIENIAHLQNLTKIEIDIIHTIQKSLEPNDHRIHRRYYLDPEDDCTIRKIINKLLLKYSQKDIRSALEPDNNLIANDFLKVNLKTLSKNWDSTQISINYNKFSKSFKSKFKNIENQELIEPKNSFNKLKIETDLKFQLMRLLNLYKSKRIKSLSFLFHGKTGSGKTSLVHALAHYLNYKIVFIRDYLIDKDNLPNIIKFLIRKYNKQKIILLFDECENLWFSNHGFSFSFGLPKNKENSWSKHILEDIEGIVAFTSNERPPDPFIRRVDFVKELNSPDTKTRIKILKSELNNTSRKLKIKNSVSSIDLEDLSLKYELTGAFLKKAVTLSLIYSEKELTTVSLEKALLDINTSLSNELSENNQKRNLILSPSQKALIEKVKVIVKNKETNKSDPLLPTSTSILLYGPPGTGKTEFSKELANDIKKNIHIANASSFLSKYVGETEQNIASIFKKCSEKNEVLFIDEAEGLFMNRENAINSWELTQINEFLKQVESFKGIIIIATNLKDRIDPAFARRFLFHVKFDLPEFEQRVKIINRFVGTKLTEKEIISLAEKYIFSPGELRNAVSLWALEPKSTLKILENLLEQQISFRIGSNEKVISLGK